MAVPQPSSSSSEDGAKAWRCTYASYDEPHRSRIVAVFAGEFHRHNVWQWFSSFGSIQELWSPLPRANSKTRLMFLKFARSSEACLAVEAVRYRLVHQSKQTLGITQISIAESRVPGKSWDLNLELFSQMCIEIPKSLSEKYLKGLFQAYGNIESCVIIKKEVGGEGKFLACIKFSKASQAARAIEECDTGFNAMWADFRTDLPESCKLEFYDRRPMQETTNHEVQDKNTSFNKPVTKLAESTEVESIEAKTAEPAEVESTETKPAESAEVESTEAKPAESAEVESTEAKQETTISKIAEVGRNSVNILDKQTSLNKPVMKPPVPPENRTLAISAEKETRSCEAQDTSSISVVSRIPSIGAMTNTSESDTPVDRTQRSNLIVLVGSKNVDRKKSTLAQRNISNMSTIGEGANRKQESNLITSASPQNITSSKLPAMSSGSSQNLWTNPVYEKTNWNSIKTSNLITLEGPPPLMSLPQPRGPTQGGPPPLMSLPQPIGPPQEGPPPLMSLLQPRGPPQEALLQMMSLLQPRALLQGPLPLMTLPQLGGLPQGGLMPLMTLPQPRGPLQGPPPVMTLPQPRGPPQEGPPPVMILQQTRGPPQEGPPPVMTLPQPGGPPQEGPPPVMTLPQPRGLPQEGPPPVMTLPQARGAPQEGPPPVMFLQQTRGPPQEGPPPVMTWPQPREPPQEGPPPVMTLPQPGGPPQEVPPPVMVLQQARGPQHEGPPPVMTLPQPRGPPQEGPPPVMTLPQARGAPQEGPPPVMILQQTRGPPQEGPPPVMTLPQPRGLPQEGPPPVMTWPQPREPPQEGPPPVMTLPQHGGPPQEGPPPVMTLPQPRGPPQDYNTIQAEPVSDPPEHCGYEYYVGSSDYSSMLSGSLTKPSESNLQHEYASSVEQQTNDHGIQDIILISSDKYLKSCEHRFYMGSASQKTRSHKIRGSSLLTSVDPPDLSSVVRSNTRRRESISKCLLLVSETPLPKEKIFSLFNAIPGLESFETRPGRYSNRVYGMIKYRNIASAVYAKYRLHGLEDALGNRLHVSFEEGGTNETELIQEMATQLVTSQLASVIKDKHWAPQLLEAPAPRIPSPHLETDAELPSRKRKAPPDSSVRERLSITFDPFPLPQEVLDSVLSRFGNFINSRIIPGENGAYAMFADRASASHTIAALHNKTVNGVKLKVMLADLSTEALYKRQRLF